MGELSILTIIVSLAVCSLLVYGIFQYMKVRLTVLEQSHREQAMILQQYIEESSSDIHRLYQISTSRYNGPSNPHPFQPNGSIILEYANDVLEEQEQQMNEKPVAFNDPHTIHLDTAFFQNKRSNNLIEISSDSENTTETESDGESNTDSDTVTESGTESDAESDADAESGTDTESESGAESDSENGSNTKNDCDSINNKIIQYDESHNLESIQAHHNTLSSSNDETTTSDVKTVTVDLGTLQEPDIPKKSISKSTDILLMMYKKAQQTPLPEDHDLDNTASDNMNEVIHLASTDAEGAVPANNSEQPPPPTSSIESSLPVKSKPSAPLHVPLASMSVPDLKQLLKELCKNQPEKHAEIQKLKKPELIYAIKQLQ